MTGADCHIGGCERDGVHVDGNAHLCDRCRERLKNGERPAPAAEPPPDDRGESAAGLGSQPAVEQQVYPADLADIEQWLTWKPTEDGRKVPRAPYEHRGQPDRFVSAQDPTVWTDRETAQRWADVLPGHGLAFTIPNREDGPEDPYVLIDYDDVRDPETGSIHPTVREHLARAESYADVSTSGTGVHIVCRGELPEDVKSIDAALAAHDDFPDAGIEVYDVGRYMAMTGAHIAETPVETRQAQEFLDALAAEYATVPEGTPEELTREPVRSREAIADVETTGDIQAVFDAIQHVRPGDIRLRSPVTEERADGSVSRDPSWTTSESGTRLAELDDGWVYRQGMVGLDALQVVALEERIVTSETEYPSGEAFWEAVDALRGRGAHIPEYVGPARSDDEPLAVLPSTPKIRALGSGWDWTVDKRAERDLTVAQARERTVRAIVDAIESLDRRLIEALPTMGKSYGAVLAAARTGVPTTILTGRGRTEQ